MSDADSQRTREDEYLYKRQGVALLLIVLLVVTAQFWFASIRDTLIENFPETRKSVMFLIGAIVFTLILLFLSQVVFKVSLNSLH